MIETGILYIRRLVYCRGQAGMIVTLRTHVFGSDATCSSFTKLVSQLDASFSMTANDHAALSPLYSSPRGIGWMCRSAPFPWHVETNTRKEW